MLSSKDCHQVFWESQASVCSLHTVPIYYILSRGGSSGVLGVRWPPPPPPSAEAEYTKSIQVAPLWPSFAELTQQVATNNGLIHRIYTHLSQQILTNLFTKAKMFFTDRIAALERLLMWSKNFACVETILTHDPPPPFRKAWIFPN